MREVAWISFHIVIVLPVALIFSVIAREAVRALVARATGFHVFEVRIGIGRRLFTAPIGPVDLSVAAWPLSGALLAASPDARRHRIRRFALAISPLLSQFAWLAWSVGPGSAGLPPIQSGFAPLTVFAVAQIILFALHLFVPLRWRADEQTDLRSLIDVVFGTPSTHRRARAAYYVRAARNALERSEVESAYKALQQGLTQLGPEPLLIECQRILATREQTSVVDQDECAEALLVLLEWTSQGEDQNVTPARSVQRFCWQGLSAMPLLGAISIYAAVHHDSISILLTQGWIQDGVAIVETASAEACASHRAKTESWPLSFDRAAPPALRRDHRYLTAQLLACEGALKAAEEVAEASLGDAEEARATHFVGVIENPPRWIDDEMRLSAVLSLKGELTLRRGGYRLALRTLKRADRELDLVRHQLGQATGEQEHPELAQRIDAQQARIREQRNRIQTEMAAR